MRFTLGQLLIAMTTLCVVGAIAAVLFQRFRDLQRSAQQLACENNIKQIGLALRCYQDIFQTFPPAIVYADEDTPMHR
jgi:uncharacterized membrane protein YhaH (DUF805 family)